MVSTKPRVQKSRNGFRVNEYIVYPAHGVGQIKFIEKREIVGTVLEMFGIEFEKEKMILRVPTNKVVSVGMRKLTRCEDLDHVVSKLRGKARIRRTTWSRRAQEYESKINSGDIILLTEVVRDLFRAEHQSDPSYSERKIYQSALARLASEWAMVDRVSEEEAVSRITEVLATSPHRMPAKAAQDVAAAPQPSREAESTADQATGDASVPDRDAVAAEVGEGARALDDEIGSSREAA